MTMQTVSSLFLLLLFCSCLDGELTTPSQPVDQISDAEYGVLSAIVAQRVQPADSVRLGHDATDVSFLLGNRDSALTQLLLYLSPCLPSLSQETMANFKAKNLTPTYIMTPSKIHPRCLHADSNDLMSTRIWVSRVGFDLSGRQALAYVGIIFGRWAGDGKYYILQYQDGQWTVIGTCMAWAS